MNLKIPCSLPTGVIPAKEGINKIVILLQTIALDSLLRGNRTRGKKNKIFSRPMRILKLFCILMLIFISPLKAEDVYEVTASSLSSPTAGTGSYETIINNTTIDNYQEIFLKDTLPYVPSIILNSSGTLGRLTDFSIRGARTSQNLVLVDGIYLNNPATGGSVDLADYLNADLQQIEVLPGPQNLAYGPGALGGVVQLIPKKGQGKPSLNVTGEGGSFRTLYGTTTAQGEEGPLQFSLTAAGFKRGPASFTNPSHGNRQSDHYKNGTFSSRIGYALTDNWEIEGLIRYIDGKVQFDETQFIPEKNVYLPFIGKNFTDIQTLLASFENKWGSEAIDHSLKVAYSRFQRSTQMPSYHNATLGEHPVLFYNSEIKLNSQNTLMAGLEAGQERARDKQLHKRSHGGIYLIHAFKPFDPTTIKGG
ncbi:MAG: TonB-dependent receptor plug domain-containing protein, partial [Alphaproteobacteria bacterium]|nr:TonB-dependent receptor plug domain-containing protein [Alphaproteobacteria bacterium]